MTATAATQTDELGPLLTRLTGDEKHLPSAISTIDVLWVLYDRILRVTPEIVDEPDRDRFLLSKGHGLAAYYGRNHDEIFRALERRDRDRPYVVIARVERISGPFLDQTSG